MDAITDFLSAVRVQGACYGRIQLSDSWAPSDAGTGAAFGVISYGQAWLHLPDSAERIHLLRGDFFLLSQGRKYSLSAGSGSAPSAVIAGRFSFDQMHDPHLTRFLPPLILIRGGQPHILSLQKTLELLASEVDARGSAAEPVSELAVRRLADLLLLQALRAHIADNEGEPIGWLYALADPHIGAALNSMHKQIDRPWTVATLAAEAGMSRSAFALRFKELMKESPLEYLTRWRMYRGSDLLRESDRKLTDVAQAVGYDSDGSFHKAFKRVVGMAPGEYRRSVGVG